MKQGQSDNKLIAKNTIFLYVRMLIVLLVSLYTSRVVLNTLGVVDFGIYNVVSGFVSLFAFLNATLSASVQRFYNYEGTKSGVNGFREVYSTSLIIHIGLSVIIFLILETAGVWYINNRMVLPAGRLFAANIVYQTSSLSLIITFLQIPYIGAIMAKQRMSFYALISLIDTALKLLMVLLLPHLQQDKLLLYAFFSLILSVIDFALYFIYSIHNFNELSFKFVLNKHLFKQILGFTGWTVVGTFAFMLKGQGLNMLLNVFFGPIINAARGIAYQVNGAISAFSQNIIIAFRPQIVDSYAESNFSRVRSLVYTESKVCFMLIATLVTPIFIELHFVLDLWLGTAIPSMTYTFTMLVLVDTLICTLNTPCTQIVQATGEIKKYQIGSTIVSLLLLPVCYLFLKLGFDAILVFVMTIVFSIINQLVCLFFANKVFPIDLKRYYKEVLLPCLLYAMLLPILPLIVSMNLNESFVRFLCVLVISILIALPLFYLLALTSSQRLMVSNYIFTKIKTYV